MLSNKQKKKKKKEKKMFMVYDPVIINGKKMYLNDDGTALWEEISNLTPKDTARPILIESFIMVRQKFHIFLFYPAMILHVMF